MDEARYAHAKELLRIAAQLFGDGVGGELSENEEYERGIIEVFCAFFGTAVEDREQIRKLIYDLAREPSTCSLDTST